MISRNIPNRRIGDPYQKPAKKINKSLMNWKNRGEIYILTRGNVLSEDT